MTDWVSSRRAAQAQAVLAELYAYEIPAGWLRRAAEHIGRTGPRRPETADEVLARWAADPPIPAWYFPRPWHTRRQHPNGQPGQPGHGQRGTPE